MKKSIIWIATIVAIGLIVGAIVLKVPAVQDAIVERVTSIVITSSAPLQGEDSLTVIFCGTGGPFSDLERAGPCTLVIAGSKQFLVDSGTGGTQRLQQMRVPLDNLQGIFYTHLHSDHISGLGDVALNSWAGGRRKALQLYGPPGVKALANGFEQAFAIDSQSRIDHHGSELFALAGRHIEPHVIEVPGRDEAVIAYESDGLKVTAFRVTHEPLKDAYGYRFQYKDRSVVFSGDTIKDDNVARFGKGADVLVHEAMGMLNIKTIAQKLKESGNDSTAKILTDASDVHTSPVEAAEIANAAEAGLLVYNHVVPPMPISLMKDRYMRGVAKIRPEGVMLGYDGLTIQLPLGSSEIDVATDAPGW